MTSRQTQLFRDASLSYKQEEGKQETACLHWEGYAHMNAMMGLNQK